MLDDTYVSAQLQYRDYPAAVLWMMGATVAADRSHNLQAALHHVQSLKARKSTGTNDRGGFSGCDQECAMTTWYIKFGEGTG